MLAARTTLPHFSPEVSGRAWVKVLLTQTGRRRSIRLDAHLGPHHGGRDSRRQHSLHFVSALEPLVWPRVVRALRHWLGGKRVKVKGRSPASSKLWATGCVFEPPLADECFAMRFWALPRSVGRPMVLGQLFIASHVA